MIYRSGSVITAVICRCSWIQILTNRHPLSPSRWLTRHEREINAPNATDGKTYGAPSMLRGAINAQNAECD
jgi:hypothetical protein